MKKLTYAEQIKNPKWQKKRLKVLEEGGFTCEECGGKEETLNIHHKFYDNSKMVWEYNNEDLKCLCETCHSARHEIEKIVKRLLEDVGILDGHKIIGYIESILGPPFIHKMLTGDTLIYYKEGYVDGERTNSKFIFNLVEEKFCK
jgi:hypothetical protein